MRDGGPHSPRVRARRAFTLVELVAVMTLLTIMLAYAAPQLGGFFRGRAQREEIRRLSALTRFARGEAIAHGERMRLWLAPERGEYGLLAQGPQREDQPPPRSYKLHEHLALQLPEETTLNEQGEAEIVFWPDGNLDAASPTEFTLLEDETAVCNFVLAANRLEYAAREVSDE